MRILLVPVEFADDIAAGIQRHVAELRALAVQFPDYTRPLSGEKVQVWVGVPPELSVTVTDPSVADDPPTYRPEHPDARYKPLLVQGPDASLIVRLLQDGTPEFGPGITESNVWGAIAQALPLTAPLRDDITNAYGIVIQTRRAQVTDPNVADLPNAALDA